MNSEKELKRLKGLKAVHKYQNNNREKVKKSQRNYRRNNYNKWINIVKDLDLDVCSKCGYNKCFAAIDFHHIDPKLKIFNVCSIFWRPFNEKNKQLFLTEVKKCIPICSNCHRELHYSDEFRRGK